VRRGITSAAIFVAFIVIITLSRHVIDQTSSTTTTVTTPPVTTTSVAATTTTAASSATTCQGSAFSGLFNEGEGAAGTVYASVTLTKRSAGTCSIKGWPILTLQDKSVQSCHSISSTRVAVITPFSSRPPRPTSRRPY